MVILHEIQHDGADRREHRCIEERVQHSWYGIRRGAVRFNLYYVLGGRMPKALYIYWKQRLSLVRNENYIRSATVFDLCVFIFSVCI